MTSASISNFVAGAANVAVQGTTAENGSPRHRGLDGEAEEAARRAERGRGGQEPKEANIRVEQEL